MQIMVICISIILFPFFSLLFTVYILHETLGEDVIYF